MKVILCSGGGSLGKHISHTFDLGTDATKLLFDIFVAAVNVVDAIDDGFPIGDEGG